MSQAADFQDYMDSKRPGIAAIRAELREAHPRWTPTQVDAEAKQEWHRRNPGPRTAS